MTKIREYVLWKETNGTVEVYFDTDRNLAGFVKFEKEGNEAQYIIAPHDLYWSKWRPYRFENSVEGTPPPEYRERVERIVSGGEPEYTVGQDEAECVAIHDRLEHDFAEHENHD